APVLYQLFEAGETVIVGFPDMNMGNDKWMNDFLPVIAASRYRDLLPTGGEGSRNGKIKSSVRFRNGAELRFMTAGGGDGKVSGFSSRVLSVTEADKMDESGESSREADRLKQLEARTEAYPESKLIFLECTVSIEEGRIWQEYTKGSAAKIMRK